MLNAVWLLVRFLVGEICGALWQRLLLPLISPERDEDRRKRMLDRPNGRRD